MHFSLIGAPLELGCGTVGCAAGGAALVGGSDGLSAYLTEQHIPHSADAAFAPLVSRRAEEPFPYYMAEVSAACHATANAVSEALGSGSFPLMLGGDHALGLGSVAGTGRHYSAEELSLIWVDAHSDINTEETTVSGNLHGVPIAALLGLCGEELSAVCSSLPVLRGENIHIFFVRDIDPPEEAILAEQGVHLYRMSDIKQKGLTAALQQMLQNITTPYCHVSWDVDCLDSESFAATGLNIPDGPTPEEVRTVLLALAESGKCVAMDCVEYNPSLDDEAGTDRETVLGILKPVLSALAAPDKE